MSAANPNVSVIMPVYNGAAFMQAGIESMLAQTDSDFELLAIDDGSTDGSWSILEAIKDPRIRRFKQPQNLGPAAARNAGLESARGKYLAFFDCDDVAAPDRLALQVGLLEKHPEYRMANGWVQPINDRGQPTQEPDGYKGNPEHLAPTLLFYNCLNTSTHICRRESVAQERFDVSLAVASDFEFWSRLAVAQPTVVIRRVLSQYRTHSHNVTQRKKDQAADCLKRIMERQLGRLGIQPTTAEMTLHLRLMQFHHSTAKEAVEKAESWLRKIEAGNRQHGVYPVEALRHVLYERWYQVCHSACGLGGWTWRTFNNSVLRSFGRPSLSARYALLRLVMRGTIKRMMGRRLRSCEAQSD